MCFEKQTQIGFYGQFFEHDEKEAKFFHFFVEKPLRNRDGPCIIRKDIRKNYAQD